LEAKFRIHMTIRSIFRDSKTVEGIILSLEPDNVGIEKMMRIKMENRKDALEIDVHGEGSLGSLTHTMDDLLRCLAVSLRTLTGNV
jgi:hypothetical protein